MEKTQCRYRPLRSGFTLAEILVVLVILGIATAIVVPQISNIGDLQAGSAARTLLANMQYAQNEAIVSQRSITVAFDADNGAYDLRYSDDTVLDHPIEKAPFRVVFADTPGLDQVAISSVNFGGDPEVTFDPLGSPQSPGQVTLAADGHLRRITVAAVTGKMALEEITP